MNAGPRTSCHDVCETLAAALTYSSLPQAAAVTADMLADSLVPPFSSLSIGKTFGCWAPTSTRADCDNEGDFTTAFHIRYGMESVGRGTLTLAGLSRIS